MVTANLVFLRAESKFFRRQVLALPACAGLSVECSLHLVRPPIVRANLHAIQERFHLFVVSRKTAAIADGYSRRRAEFHLLLRQAIVNGDQVERAKFLAKILGLDLDIQDADPKKNRHSYYKRFVLRVRPKEASMPPAVQVSLFGG